jgi:hypothetical protein
VVGLAFVKNKSDNETSIGANDSVSLFIGMCYRQNHLRNEGSVFQDSDRVILDKARMQQTRI